MSWSGGKDSAVALHELRTRGEYEVVALMTTVSEAHRRISHHGVREELLDAQAAAIGLPLTKVYLPSGPGGCSNELYESLTAAALRHFSDSGVNVVAYGDLFLEDLRQWRETSLARIRMRAVFPLWQRDTRSLAEQVIADRYRAYISCVERRVGEQFAGRLYDTDFLSELPPDIDRCGEHGEFHSFVFDGPPFAHRVDVSVGETVLRDDRFYADLLPGSSASNPHIGVEAIPPVR